MNELIEVITENKELFGAATNVSGLDVPFDAQGRGKAAFPQAAVLMDAEGFRLVNEADRERIEAWLKASIPTPEGPYDPGAKVRIFLPRLAGERTIAPDNCLVEFDLGGYAICGEKTAQRLKDVHSETEITSLSPPEPEPPPVTLEVGVTDESPETSKKRGR